MEGNSSKRNLEPVQLSTLSGLKRDQKCGSVVIHGHLLTFGLDGQGLREDKIGRLTQGLGKEVCG